MRLPLDKFRMPDDKGTFGAIRKHDIHTGIDLYCREGTTVYAIEDGIVVNVEDFTGLWAGSPWWEETQAVLIEGKHGVICYGEITPSVKLEQEIKEGDIIGTVKRVLPKNKGRPTTMLHLELYKPGTRNTVWWKHGDPKPDELLDPRFDLFLSDDWDK